MQARIVIFSVLIVTIGILITGARLYWINQGKAKCENSVAVATQEKVVENDKKLRPVRSYRPSVERVAKRMRGKTF